MPRALPSPPARLVLPALFASIIAAALAAGAAAPGVSPTAVPPDPSADQAAVLAKLERWREMFSATGRGEAFDTARYPDLFLPGAAAGSMLTFDQYAPAWASTQIDGVAGYAAVWNRDVNESFPGWTIEKMEVLRCEVDGDLAWTALNFWGAGERAGEPYEGSQHGTHVWRDVDPGPARDWRIAHEHLTQIQVRGEPNVRYDGAPPAPQPPPAGGASRDGV